MKDRRTILVFASTFPRWKDDTNPPFVYELSKRLTNEFDVHVLAPAYPGTKNYEVMDKMKVHRFHYFFPKYEKLAGSGGILPTLKKNKWFYFQVPFFMISEFFALKRLVKKIKPDVIHAHWIIPQGFITALVHKLTGVPYVVTSHGSDIMGLNGFTAIKKFTLSNAKKITVVSNDLKSKVLKIDKSLNVEVIPMGIDTKLFNPNKKDLTLKKKYGVQGQFILFVGRLAPEKGIDLLIEAMPGVIKKLPKAKLIIIGDGTLKQELKDRVKNLGIEKNIIFLGWINNNELPKYYATADLFVCPSRREGSPVSYIEALACGTQILVGDIPISREILKNEEHEITKLDVLDIQSKINSLITNKGIKHKKVTVERYEWGNISKKYKEVLWLPN